MNDGYESFESDFNIFNNKMSLLIDSRNKDEIVKVIKEKHLSEIYDEVDKEHKTDDLIIWNAIYTREIIRNGIAKKYLHPIYNKFYRRIKESSSIQALQEIELDMINEYMELLINDTEITDSFTVNKLLQALHLNIENHISLEEICKNLNISVGYASTCFKKYKGVSVMKYLREIKIERAKILLLSTEKSILEISILLGFHDQSHFTNTFKKLVGVSPLKFRNKNYSI